MTLLIIIINAIALLAAVLILRGRRRKRSRIVGERFVAPSVTTAAAPMLRVAPYTPPRRVYSEPDPEPVAPMLGYHEEPMPSFDFPSSITMESPVSDSAPAAIDSSSSGDFSGGGGGESGGGGSSGEI